MKYNKFLIFKIFFILVISPLFINVSKANAAEEIKSHTAFFLEQLK